jgi:two-component system cell cycle response regulator
VDDGNKAWEVVQRNETVPELIILDWLMPGMDGLELCRRIRDRQQDRYQYVLLISGRDDKQDVIEGLDAGADDYLTKPLDARELRARLRSGKRILSLQHDLIQTREELRYQATHDGLTGIWSRGAVLNLLQCELQRGMRTEVFTGILMIDLDHFKNINDTYGHLVGDAVLKEVAGRISHAVRSYDFVGRYGGEEFLAILSNCSAEDLRLVADRTRTVVAESPVRVDSVAVSVTVSIGAAVARNGTPEVELLSTADDALYEAKRAGRNRVVIASCHEKATHREKAARANSHAG